MVLRLAVLHANQCRHSRYRPLFSICLCGGRWLPPKMFQVLRRMFLRPKREHQSPLVDLRRQSIVCLMPPLYSHFLSVEYCKQASVPIAITPKQCSNPIKDPWGILGQLSHRVTRCVSSTLGLRSSTMVHPCRATLCCHLIWHPRRLLRWRV